MLAAAAALGLALLALAALPSRLARATWPLRSPSLGLLLWQAAGLAAGLLALEATATVALAPFGPTHAEAVRRLLTAAPPAPPVWALLAALTFLALGARLLGVLAGSAGRTLRSRRDNRRLVDLVATRNPLLRGACVVEHDLPLAYCLPGLRARVVVSRGMLCRLTDPEVAAVLAHEHAHLAQRHDLVVLPFTALGATFPQVPAVHTAREEVALLVEMLADDSAARGHDRTALARALYKVGTADVPAGSLGAGDSGVLVRAGRLLDPPAPLSRLRAGLAVGAAAALVVLPLSGLVLPLVE